MITDKIFKNLIQQKDNKDNEFTSTIYMINKNLNTFVLRESFVYIEFLSVQNNNLSDISFLKFLPNLYYLDIRNNPVEKFDVLNTFPSFGFLGLSVEKYQDKKILTLKRINLGILNLNVDDSYKKVFKNNNPNIIKFNEEILYFYQNYQFHTNTYNPDKSKLFQINTQESLKFSTPKLLNKININNLPKNINSNNFNHSNINLINEQSKNIFSFFEHFNKEIGNLITIYSDSINLSENLNYIKEEKNKLIILSKIYERIIILNKDDERILTVKKKINNHSNNNSQYELLDNLNNLEEKTILSINKLSNFSFFKIKEIFLLIIILIVILLYILQIIGKEIAAVILKFLYKNFLQISIKIKDIKKFLEMDTQILIGFYFDLYDHFIEIYNSSNFSNYEEIKNSLEIQNLILQSNILNQNKIKMTKINETNDDLEMRKSLINSLVIKLIDEKLKIFNNILILIQFLNDFIVLNKINSILLREHTFQYRVFNEIRDLMFSHLNSKTNLVYDTLTYRQYAKHKFQRFGNKLIFMKKTHLDERKSQEIVKQNIFNFMNSNVNTKTSSNFKKKIEINSVVIKKQNEIIKNESLENEEINNSLYKLMPKNYYDKTKIENVKNKFNNSKNTKSYTKNNSTDDFEYNYFNNLIPKEELDNMFRTTQLKNANINRIENVNAIENIKFKNKDNFNENENLTLKSPKYKIQTHTVFPNFNRIISRKNSINKNSKKFSQTHDMNIFKQNIKNIKLLSEEIKENENLKKQKVEQNSPEIIPNIKNINLLNKTSKTVYDFKYNMSRLTHHWTQNNPNARENKTIKDNNYDKTIKLKSNRNPQQFMTAEDIFSLFSIENKNDDIRNNTSNTKNKKYTIKRFEK